MMCVGRMKRLFFGLRRIPKHQPAAQSTDSQSTPQGSEMNLNVINEPTENFHIFLAEENPTLGNFYYFSP